MKVFNRHQKPVGRPATRRDKNGRPMPVRADRDRPVQWFFENIPRATLEEALQLSGDPRLYRLYDALHDPAYRNTSLMTLCRKFGIPLHDLVELWRDYNVCLGMIRMVNHLPEIMEHTAENALPRDVFCPRCDGLGNVVDWNGPRTCPICEGAGKVRVPGDNAACRLVFEIAGLIGRNRAPIVAIQQNFGAPVSEDTVKDIRKIIMEPDS